MTKDELKTELDALGVDYPKDAKLGELEALYAPYAPSTDTGGALDQNEPEEQPQTPQGGNDEPLTEAIDPDRAVVAAKHGVNMRETPGGTVAHVLPEGAVCDVLEAGNDWSRVSCRVEGWVRTELLNAL